jgi:hypothetical protein
MEVKGRNLSEGVPRSFTISSNEVLEALTDPLNQIVSAVKNALEQTPPELGADIAERGMMLTGGGALLRDLDRLLAEETGLPVLVAEEPLTCVVRGCGMALEPWTARAASSPASNLFAMAGASGLALPSPCHEQHTRSGFRCVRRCRRRAGGRSSAGRPRMSMGTLDRSAPSMFKQGPPPCRSWWPTALWRCF